MAVKQLPSSLPTSGLLSARPTATGSKVLYTATDASGGTTYLDTASGVWTPVAGPVLPTTSPGGPAYNFSAANFTKWRKAMSQVRNGGGYAKLFIAGDSTSWGKGGGGSNPPYVNAWPKRLQELLNSYMVPASVGLNAYGNADPADSRWTLGTGWSISTSGGFATKCLLGNGGTATTFAPGYACDTADIYSIQYTTGMGSCGVSVDGGGTTTIAGTGTSSVKKTTITFPAGSAHTISFGAPSGGNFFIIGVDCYDSTTKSVRVSLTGVSTSTTTDWINNSNAFQSLSAITTYAPDLTIIQLGINDAQFNSWSAATWSTNTQTLITAAKASGDVILATVVPTNPTGHAWASLEADYAAAAQTLAATNGCGLVDIYNRFGSYTAANAAGYMADDFHTTGFGDCDMAQAIFNGLKTI